MTNGRQTSGNWYNSDIDLMNEQMVYGCPILQPANDGTNIPYNYTIDKTQLKLFAERPDLTYNKDWWLRDVVSDVYFAHVSDKGAAYFPAGFIAGIRPAFAIC